MTILEPRRPRRRSRRPAARSSTRATCARASCTSGSAPSTGRTRPSTPRPPPPAPASRGASSPSRPGSVRRADARAGLPVLGHRPGARRGRDPGGRLRRRGPAAPRRRAARPSCCARPRSRVVTLTVTEKGYSPARRTAALDTAAPGVAADLAATADTADAGPRHGRRTARRLARRPVPGRRRADRLVSCDNMAGNGAALAGVVRGVRRRRPPGATRTRCSTGSATRSASRPRGRPDRPGHHRRPTATPPARRSACATRWPSSASRTGSGCCRTPSSPPRPPLGARRRAGRRRRRALPVDEVAPAQRVSLRAGLPRAAAGCTTVTDVLATEWGERLVRSVRRRGRPDPARRRARRRHVHRRPGRPVQQPRHAAPAAPDRVRRIAEDPRALVLGAAGAARGRGRTPVLELALAGWVNATRPDAGGSIRHDGPRRRGAGRCWTDTADPQALVAALLREVGAADLAEQARPHRSVAAAAPGAARRTDRHLTAPPTSPVHLTRTAIAHRMTAKEHTMTKAEAPQRGRRDANDQRPRQGRGVRLAGHGHGVHGLPAVLAGRGDRLQQDLLPQRQPGDRADRGDGDLRRRLRRPARRRDLLRPDGRPDRPQEGPVPHDRPDGRLDHPDRRAAHLRA